MPRSQSLTIGVDALSDIDISIATPVTPSTALKRLTLNVSADSNESLSTATSTSSKRRGRPQKKVRGLAGGRPKKQHLGKTDKLH